MRLMLTRIVLVAAHLVTAVPAGAVTFDDGMIHVIDSGTSFPLENVTVRDGPGGDPASPPYSRSMIGTIATIPALELLTRAGRLCQSFQAHATSRSRSC